MSKKVSKHYFYYITAQSCPSNLVFNNCASPCNFTCDDADTGPVCDDQTCVPKCACPENLPVLYKGT